MIANHSQPCPARDQNLPGSPPSYFYPAKGRGEGRAWLQGTTDCGFSLLYIPYGSKFLGSKTFAIFVSDLKVTKIKFTKIAAARV